MLSPRLILFCALLASVILSFVLYNLDVQASIPSIKDSRNVVDADGRHGNETTSNNGSSNTKINMKSEGLFPNDVCQVSINFPDYILRWCDLITNHAQEYGLDPDLLAALILQESTGNPDAYSRSGAVGLMQVMPRDGLAAFFYCSNGPCFRNRPTIEELKDPEFNLAYGTEMLANLISRYKNIRDALKAYGPMDVGYDYSDRVLGLYKRYRE